MGRMLKEKIGIFMDIANVIFLFLFSIHLCNFPDKYIILWCLFSSTLFFIRYKKLCLDKSFIFLALAILLNGAGTYYYLADDLSYSIGNIIKLVVPTILVYPVLKQMVWNKKDSYVEIIIWTIVLGTFLYSILNYNSYVEHGFFRGERVWSEFWTDYPMNATHHSYWGCFVVGLSGCLFYCFFNKKWLMGTVLIFLVVIENYINIVVDNRMVLCVTLLSLAVGVILFIYLNRTEKKIMKNVFQITVLIAITMIMLFITDIGGIKSNGYIERFITRDGGILNNIRFRMIYEAIMMLPSHWKGGANMWAAGWYWVHNYWLQVANVSGIIPFMLWMIVNLDALVNIIKIIKSSYVSEKIKYMLIPMFSSIVGYLMMEPGGTELNRYIIFYVMLLGILKQLANKNSVESTEKVGVKNV